MNNTLLNRLHFRITPFGLRTSILLGSLMLLFCMSCKKESEQNKPETTYADFEQHLTSEMTYSAIVTEFGEPSDDIGSGIHIYVYTLSDSTEVWIGYADKIIYARHIDKQGVVLETLLEDASVTKGYSYFKDNIEPTLTYTELIALFGIPAEDKGSGIHIYVYPLNDLTEVWIGYADEILYVKLMNSEQQLIENLY